MEKLARKDFDFFLPKKLIAQKPTDKRSHSRLLLVDKSEPEFRHDHFYNLANYFRAGDVLVLNDSKVLPARLSAHKEKSLGKVEIFLLKKIKDSTSSSNWECLLKGRVQLETNLIITPKFQAQVISKLSETTFELVFNQGAREFRETINSIGQVPLPPYIKRLEAQKEDKERYQTVYAKPSKQASVAAPTAGLHFTKKLLTQLKDKGVIVKYLTLHVGLGTFAPIKSDYINDHKMHQEYVEIGKADLIEIVKAKQAGQRIVATGTTSCRALESLASKFLANQALKLVDKNKNAEGLSYWTDIFIYPGYQFQLVDALITNFHLPQSSLFLLVSALAGTEKMKQAYKIAIAKEYRFYSYGDAMFIS